MEMALESGAMKELDVKATQKLLNRIMEFELAGVVRYTHYSLMVAGPNRIPIVQFMKTQATESLLHGQMAGEILVGLGGHPTLSIAEIPETYKHSVKDILEESLNHERTALDIYKKPATTFVASFIGAPPMNIIPLQGNDAKLAGAGSGAGILGIRPEDLVIANEPAPAGGIMLDLIVEAIEQVGAETYVYGVRSQHGDAPTVSAKPGELPPGEILVRVPGQSGPAIGERIRAVAARDKLHLFSADGRKRVDS